GLGDDFLRDKPVFADIAQAFVDFVRDDKLIIHNAAFDMKFLKLQEKRLNLKFDNPVLDTLLLSAYLYDYSDKHDLDTVAERFDLKFESRHSALGDSLVTAGALLKMIDILEGRGVLTLADAIAALQKVLEKRAAPEF
ncbi:MAG: PolC-type DNA polymerase III, partial [Rhodospirillales bacterium]